MNCKEVNIVREEVREGVREGVVVGGIGTGCVDGIYPLLVLNELGGIL